MASRDQLKEIIDQLSQILREILHGANWDASLLLRTASKRLQELYEEAERLSIKLGKTSAPDAATLHQDKINQGYILVYVSIYQAEPHSLAKWENTLKTIREYSITRPIYRVEEYVAEAIRSKIGSVKEAYVSVYIKPDDIIAPYAGKKVEDRWGHELLTLRDNCLLTSNIVEFVHQGKRYTYRDGKLVLKS